MSEIDLLTKILLSVRIISYTLSIFLGIYIGSLFGIIGRK